MHQYDYHNKYFYILLLINRAAGTLWGTAVRGWRWIEIWSPCTKVIVCCFLVCELRSLFPSPTSPLHTTTQPSQTARLSLTTALFFMVILIRLKLLFIRQLHGLAGSMPVEFFFYDLCFAFKDCLPICGSGRSSRWISQRPPAVILSGRAG